MQFYDGANVPWTQNRHAGLDSRSLHISAVCIEAAHLIPIWKRDVGIAAQPEILMS